MDSIPPRIVSSQFMALKPCRHGVMAYNTNDTFVGRSLELYGEWCESELDLLAQFIQVGSVVLDVGANIGTHTVCFARQVTSRGLVLAFEPQRWAYQTLCTNAVLNALPWVHCRRQLVAEQDGLASIPELDPSVSENFGAYSPLRFRHLPATDRVEVVAIDGLGLAGCDLIKIDVEGMETQVLHGAQATIGKYQPVLYVENNAADRSRQVIELIQSVGYHAHWHIAPYFNPRNFFENQENVFEAFQPEANMLCLPPHMTLSGLSEVLGVDDTWEAAQARNWSDV